MIDHARVQLVRRPKPTPGLTNGMALMRRTLVSKPDQGKVAGATTEIGHNATVASCLRVPGEIKGCSETGS